MSFIFYILQLILPYHYTAMPLQLPVSPVETIYYIGNTSVSKEVYSSHKTSIGCLAEALFYESRGESSRGNKLIAQVVVNRTKSPQFPDTVCKVIKHKINGRYQYSYHHLPNTRKHLLKKNQTTYNKMYRIADKVLTDNFEKRKILTKALYYKVCDVESEFFERLKYLGREDNHCFFTVNKTT